KPGRRRRARATPTPVHQTVGHAAKSRIVSLLECRPANAGGPEAVDRARRPNALPCHRVGGEEAESRAEAMTGDENRQARGAAPRDRIPDRPRELALRVKRRGCAERRLKSAVRVLR